MGEEINTGRLFILHPRCVSFSGGSVRGVPFVSTFAAGLYD